MRLEEYAAHDGLALAELVREGHVTPAELAHLAVRGAERTDPRLGAIAGLYDDAVESAEAAEPGPFHGVPVLLKDLYHGDAGRPTEAGSRLAEGWVAQVQSELVRRVRACGMVPVGRATTSEFGVMGTTETIACGPTSTPWSGDHMAGGSSGGSGAAVGAGIVPIATGSDGGGSIRIPASACGVVGLKTSRGRVTWAPAAGEPLLGWAVHHVLTRSLRDTAACLDELAAPYPGEPFTLPGPPDGGWLDQLHLQPGPLRIAVCWQPWSGAEPVAEIRAACEATATLLSGLGHELVEASPEFSWEQFLNAMTVIWSSTTAQTVDGFAQAVGREPSPDNLELPTFRMVEFGRAVKVGELLNAIDSAGYVSRQVRGFFHDYDLLLTPTLGALPARLGTYRPDEELEPKQLFGSWAHLESFLPVFNASGQPAISLPLHMSEQGLPIGMQLVGRVGAEATLLRVAAQLEQALPWAARVPPLHVSDG